MEYRVPELGEGVYEAELVQWKVQPGDAVQAGQNLVEVVTDKATMELPAPFSGRIEQLLAGPGQMVRIGDPILAYSPSDAEDRTVDRSEEPSAADRSATVKTFGTAANSAATVLKQRQDTTVDVPKTAAASNSPSRVKAAPSVRRMARALGVDLGRVKGTGPGGRILIDDVAAQASSKPAATKKTRAARHILDLGVAGTRIPVRGIRRRVAENMILSKKIVPHYSYVDECDVTAMLALAQALKRPLHDHGVHLTNLAFFVKAVANALQEVPIVNASLEEETAEIILHAHYHIGIATTTNKGLTVPVIRDADKRDLVDIAREIERLTRAVRAGKLHPEELQGGTFTISSVGAIGGMVTTPIINHPEAGIMGVGRVFKRPVYNDAGDIVPASILYLSFSFDHRIVDGSVGATFGNAVIRQLTNPAAMLLPPDLDVALDRR